MPLYSLGAKTPSVHPTAFVAPDAVLVGDVTVEAAASIWYGAVLRADEAAIVVAAGANVQDNTVVHTSPGNAVRVGADATVGHSCVVHGAVLEDGALVGNGSTVLDGAVVGKLAMVAAGALVRPGQQVGAETVVAGVPAKERGTIDDVGVRDLVTSNSGEYQRLAALHRTAVPVRRDPQGE